jgi:hypothetical protein
VLFKDKDTLLLKTKTFQTKTKTKTLKLLDYNIEALNIERQRHYTVNEVIKDIKTALKDSYQLLCQQPTAIKTVNETLQPLLQSHSCQS